MPAPRRKIDTETAKRFIARYSSADEAVRRLLIDNYAQREKIRSGAPADNGEAEREIERLQGELDDVTLKLPKDGEVVVPKSDAEALVKYKALGTPEEIDAKVKKSSELETTLADKSRDELSDTAADALGWSGKAVLRDQVRSRGLTIEMRDQTVDGKTVKVPFAKGKDASAAFEPLATLADRDLKDYLPALKAASTTATQQTGVQFPVQNQESSRAATGDAADQFLARRNERAQARPNPLAPPVAAKSAA